MDYHICMDKVLETFEALIDDVSDETSVVMCRSAMGTIESLLDYEKELFKLHNNICYAAGCLAFYRQSLKTASEDCEGFKAGDITVSPNNEDRVNFAKELYHSALEGISSAVKSKGFGFIGV